MKPLNTEERWSAFWRFFLLFFVTTIIVVWAFYFNYRVPQKENVVLKVQNDRFNEILKFQKEFTEDIKGAKNLLDSINIPGRNVQFIDLQVGKTLANLKQKVEDKHPNQRVHYDYIIQLNLALQTTKRELRELKAIKQQIDDYQEALKICRDDLEQSKRDLDQLRQAAMRNR